MLQGILYGYKVSEIIWKYSAGAVTIDRIIGKHPRRFVFTMDRELRLLTPQSMIEGEQVPERKFITFTYGDSDNPYGKGLGQKLWWPVWFKKHGIKFWLVFAEKFGMPTAVGKYPPGTLPDQQQALLDAIDAIQNETGVKIPNTMTIELMEAQRYGTVNTYETLCDFMDRQISKAVLGQTLTTEVKGEGSYAASKTHDNIRQEIVEADADLQDECLNNALIRWIVDYNFPDVTNYPKYVTHAQPKPDLKERCEIDKTVVNDIGVPVSKKYFYEMYNIPEPAEGEEVVMPNSLSQEKKRPVNDFVEGKETTDDLAERLEVESGPLFDDMAESVHRLIENAESLEAVRDGILDLFPEMETKDLGAVMQRALTAAELAGRYEVTDDR